MNWKNRLTNYNFWISMFSAVLLILQALKIEFDVAYVNEIFTAVLGLLVVVGIIIDPTKTTTKTTNQTSVEKTKEIEENAENGTEKLPIDEKNETDNINNENDFQTVLKNIANDFAVKIKELDAINKETASHLVELQRNEHKEDLEEIVEKVVHNNDEVQINITPQQVVEPAVAELENPYVDLMK